MTQPWDTPAVWHMLTLLTVLFCGLLAGFLIGYLVGRNSNDE